MLHWKAPLHGEIQEKHSKKHNRKGRRIPNRELLFEDEIGQEFTETLTSKELQKANHDKKGLKSRMVQCKDYTSNLVSTLF